MAISTTTKRIYNFSAGPATLPLPVLEEAQRDLMALPGAGASVLEISHRSPTFDKIIGDAEADLRHLLNIPDNYVVLFLQGGATLQFSMVPVNLMRGRPADYVKCGTWSKKAMDEAKKEGEARVVWDGSADKFNRMPEASEIKVNADAAYLHVTSNETIEGVEYHTDPHLPGATVVCDASSDFLSRPMDVSRYGLIYAGAQKNVGPAGAVIVIMRKDLLEGTPAKLHTMLDYKVMADNKSLYNTPPVFTIYMVGLVLRWLRTEVGGLPGMLKKNQEKANLLYSAIDRSGGFYKGHAQPQSRSLMNVTFRLPSEELEKKFVKEAETRHMDGLKGHRSVGGIRASIYNAFPYEGVEALVELMDEFHQKNS
ncbi:MAG TPA: 3-phosphoserine/phosphohydroxythreonine transaminase [Candidatus Xenobia bacterium]|jgi:phosphoserine aminotransferase